MISPESPTVLSFGLLIKNTSKAIDEEVRMYSAKEKTAFEAASKIRTKLSVLQKECPYPEEKILLDKISFFDSYDIETVFYPIQNVIFHKVDPLDSNLPKTIKKADDQTYVEFGSFICDQYKVAELDRVSPVF